RENDGIGLYYYRARYYSPVFQRFIVEDPLGFRARDYNLFAYVRNNPMTWIDPSGEAPMPPICRMLYALTSNVCNEKTRCDEDDPCPLLWWKASRLILCVDLQKLLSSTCYPDDITHLPKIESKWRGAINCLRIIVDKCACQEMQ